MSIFTIFSYLIFNLDFSFQLIFHTLVISIEAIDGYAPNQIYEKENLRSKDKNQFLYLQVKRLEDAMSSMKINYEAKFETLSKELETERLLRQKLQEDLKKSAHKY